MLPKTTNNFTNNNSAEIQPNIPQYEKKNININQSEDLNNIDNSLPEYSILDIDGLEVLFPFPSAYPEQIQYMKYLKLSLDATGPCVLEMPSGTGKTISLLSLIISYMSQHEEIEHLLYCTRTINEMEQGMMELKRLNYIRKQALHLSYDENFLGIALTCRANLCLNSKCADLPTKQMLIKNVDYSLFLGQKKNVISLGQI